MPAYIRELLYAWSVGLPLLALDQYTKFLVLEHFHTHTRQPVIDGFFNLVLVHNEGAAWGMFHGKATGLILFSIVVLVALLAFHRRIFLPRPWHRVCFGLMLAGIIGNLVDRIRFGAVTDFLDFHVGPYHWPAFNVADSCICVAVGIYLVLNWRTPPQPTDPPHGILQR